MPALPGRDIAGDGNGVKAAALRYERASSLADALALLQRHGASATLIAGGQSLVPALNLRMAAPELLIDISRLDALRGVQVMTEGGSPRLRIGAMTRHAELGRSPEIARHAPLLHLAVGHVAHAAIRNRGTFGGSLAHADPASELPACALALGARMHVVGLAGARVIDAGDFFIGLHQTALQPGEILVAVEVDVLADGFRPGFAELARRQGDYALVGLAAHARPIPGQMRFAAIAPVFFSVGARPLLAAAAARVLTDATIADADRLHLAQQALAADLDPPADPQASSAMRLHLARVLLGRVVAQLVGTPDVI